MPRCSKASTAAHTKWKQSNNQFTWTSPEISDIGSLYNDPGDENSGEESSVLDDFDGIDSSDDDTAESLESLQKLYMVFLHPNKQKEVQKRMVSNKSHREFTFTHWQLKGRIMQVDLIWSKEGYDIYWRLMHQWLAEKEKPKQSCRRVPEHDSIFSGKWEDHFQRTNSTTHVQKPKCTKKRSHPSLPIEIEESESEIKEVSALADPDDGNIDPIMELDIDVHDFSIGQLEKDVTRGPETSKDNNPIEDENVHFIIRNLTQSWLRSLHRFLRMSQKLPKVQWSLQSPLSSQRQGNCWLGLRMKITRILIFLALWAHS